MKFIQIRGVQTRTYVTLYLRNFTPDNIEIRMIHNDVPTAYAIGMNKIIVTDSLLENPYFLEPKIMFELHRIHNMASNLLPVVVGSNVILILVLLILLITTLFGGFKKIMKTAETHFGQEAQKQKRELFYFMVR